MKLLQLNIWGGRLGKQVYDLIEKEKPDIICFQEAVSMPGGSNGGWFVTVDNMKQDFKMDLAYSPVMNFSFMKRKAEWGNAIFTKLPIKSQKTVFTRLEYINDFDFEATDYNARNLLHVTLEHNKQPLHILTHHGHHVPTHKKGDLETMRQCKQIADYIKELDGSIILTGDFNLEPHSESVEQINEILNNLSIKAKLKTTRTPLTHKTEVCDYIFTSKDIKVQDIKALEDIASDHQALVVTF